MTVNSNPIAEARKASGITQSQLAAVVNTNIRVIQRYESGERSISGMSLSMAIKICDVLKVADVRSLLSHE